jgi:hypothetical protein
MGDIKFSCPGCNQHITCDELWGGHELACPSCQTPLVVPAPPASAPSGGNPLVPKPPQSFGARLARPQAPEPAAGPPQSRGIPIRNLAPPPAKKQNLVLKILKVAAVLAVVGAGCYFAFVLFRNMQTKANAKRDAEEARNSGQSQVGHIAEVNAVMDATESLDGGGSSSGPRSRSPRQRRAGAGQPVPVAGDASAGGASPETQGPLVPPVWTLDVATSKIPEGPVNGTLSGTNFVPEATRIDPVAGAQILHFLQGQPPVPDREIFVYLHLKPGEKLGGQTLTIASDMKGTGVPQVTKRWKTDPRYAPQLKSFLTGYAMKLELGQLADGAVPGKIYLALPDAEQSVLAGVFKAHLPGAEPVAAAPTAVPSMNLDPRRRYSAPR